MKVQIIIPTINLWKKYTEPCIQSVFKACEGLDYRILLVDNASTDETLIEAGKLVSDKFAHKRNERIWGCAETWNWGIKDAFERGYDYVFVINNDVLLHPESIKQLLNRFEQSKKHDEGVEREFYSDHYMRDSFLENIAMITCMDVTGECPQPQAVFDLAIFDKANVPESEHPCFSGFMIDRRCWEKVGVFDENFKPAYYEDNDYHYRINLARLKAIVLPTSLFYHYGSRTNLEA